MRISSYPSRCHPGRRRGVILIAVLGFVFLIAVFVTQFLELATRQMQMRALELGRTDLRMTAYSALEVTLATIAEFKEIDEGLNRPTQGWGDPINYAQLAWPEGVEITVTVSDETARIPLYPVPEEDIKALLESMEIDFTDTDIMVDSLVDWMDEDDSHRLNGAEDSHYEREDPPYLPANAPLTNFKTLAKIRGFDEVMFDEDGNPNNLFYRFINAVSLHNTDKVNVNTASLEVLEAYAGENNFDERQFSDFMVGLDREPGTMDDEIIRSTDDLALAGFDADTEGLGFTVAMVRVEVDVTAGEKQFSLMALVDTGVGSATTADEDDEEGQDGPENPPSDDESSGQSGQSGFTLVRLVENANFD